MREKKHMHTVGVFALLISAAFWASAYLFVKQVIDTLSPYYLLSFRYILAALVMLLIALPKLKIMTKDLLKNGMLMGVALFFEFLTFTVGLKYTTASRSSFIVAGYIVILPLAYMLIRRKVPKKQEIFAAFICMAGVALILTGGEAGMNKGDIITIFCAVSYAFHIVLSGKSAKQYDGVLLNLVQITTTAVLATITALLSGRPPEALNSGQMVSILYLALGATIIPYLLCLFGQKYVSTTTSGIVLSFESVFATLLSILFLHDKINVQFALGGLLVIGAIFVSELDNKNFRIKKENQNMAKELPKRSEVRKEDTWAIEDMYVTVADWEAELKKVQELAAQVEEKRDTAVKSAKNLLETLNLYFEMEQRFELVGNYASRAADVDTKNTENQANFQKVMAMMVDISSRLAFLEPAILELSADTLDEYRKEEPELERYRLWFEELFRTKEHTLTAELEELIAATGEMQQTPEQIFSMFSNADLEFPEITDENGEQVRITSGRYISMLCSADRRVRKDAFTRLYATYKKFENTLAAMYSGQVKQQMFLAKIRKYNSTLEAAVDANNVSPKVYENLVETIHDNLDKMYRYVSLRKKCLGVEELHMYDVYTPMVADADKKIPFEKAKETVLKAIAPLGERYVSLVKEGFDHRWLDVYENEGKRSGAYSAGAYGTHPFVLLNYDEKLDDMFTLAHEMGHAMHSYFSNETQPYVYSQYKIFVAEVASTCNEVLLMEYLLANTTDQKERAYLINHFLDSFKGTVYRQTMFAEYEKTTNAMAEAGESLTADVLKKVYYDLNCKYFGPDMVSDDEIAWEWCRIPHFYYNFYVYQYATGFSAAVAIARRILKEGQPAVDDYMRFLSGGCSKAPVELLKIAGVDMTTKAPIQSALDVFGELLDEMETLV